MMTILPVSLSNHIGFLPWLAYRSPHHSPESIIQLRTGSLKMLDFSDLSRTDINLPMSERLSPGMMRIAIHMDWPVDMKSGSAKTKLRNWTMLRDTRQQIQNFMALMRLRVKCLDSRIRWKMEISSSILKLSEEATELSSWLMAMGEGPSLGGMATAVR